MFTPTVKLIVDGREASPEDFGEGIKARVYNDLKASITEKLRGIRCPEHGDAPLVTAEGSSLDKLEWKISGCCERLRDETQKALSRD